MGRKRPPGDADFVLADHQNRSYIASTYCRARQLADSRQPPKYAHMPGEIFAGLLIGALSIAHKRLQ